MKHTAHKPSYGGLGASVAAFKRQNVTIAPSVPTPGVATYTIDAVAHGRVTALSVKIDAHPAMSNPAALGLVEGIDLPDDVAMVKQTGTCEVFKSARLAALIGSSYARATTATRSNASQVAAVSDPSC